MAMDSATLYKLMILYMLNKVDFPLTNSQISEFFLENAGIFFQNTLENRIEY